MTVSQIDRAVEVMKQLEVLVPEHQFRAALRAYQAPRVWTVEELDALPDGAVLRATVPEYAVFDKWDGRWWRGLYGRQLDVVAGFNPLRLAFNPDDVKED